MHPGLDIKLLQKISWKFHLMLYGRIIFMSLRLCTIVVILVPVLYRLPVHYDTYKQSQYIMLLEVTCRTRKYVY